MIQPIENGQEMLCWKIEEKYPDHYILIEMVETDYDTGKRTGIPLALGDEREEFYKVRRENNTVLIGDNLTFRIGGFL